MASRFSSRWLCWNPARTSITESISASAGVYLRTGDWGVGKKAAQRSYASGARRRELPISESGHTLAAVSFGRITQANRFGVCQTNDRCRKEAHADHQAFDQMLTVRFGGDDRRLVHGRRPAVYLCPSAGSTASPSIDDFRGALSILAPLAVEVAVLDDDADDAEYRATQGVEGPVRSNDVVPPPASRCPRRPNCRPRAGDGWKPVRLLSLSSST
jgi:hypothetical protein